MFLKGKSVGLSQDILIGNIGQCFSCALVVRNIPILQCKSMRFTTFFREHNVLCINHLKLHQESSKRSKDYKNDS